MIFKLTVGSQLIIIPLVFFLIFDNYYSIKLFHEKVAESKRDTITLYMDQIDSELKNIDAYLLRIITSDSNISNLENPDEGNRMAAKVSLNKNIVESISSYQLVDGIYIYSKATKDYLYSYSARTNYNERIAMEKYTISSIENGTSFNKRDWFPASVNSSYYILRNIKVGDTYIGAWINVKTFLNYLNGIDLKQIGSVILATSSGKPMNNIDYIKNNKIDLSDHLKSYYFSGSNKNFMVIGKDSKLGSFRLLSVNKDKSLLEGLNSIQIFIIFIAIISIFLVPLTILILKKWIFKPVNKLKFAIDKIESGELDYQIKDEEHPYEFMILNKAFNNMVSQIKQLKIDVYEEQIHKQKAELQYLQMQIRPHFYLNAFNTIFSMAEMKDYKLIQELVRYLADYLRYMCKKDSLLVPFEDELKHVQNFLQIQRIRSGVSLSCEIDTDQRLMDIHIPPLILLTFIENIVKHALDIYEPITVLIKAALIENEHDKYVNIMIQDSGKGFSAEALVKINQGIIHKDQGQSIGIWNVKQRIKLIYGDKACIKASNSNNSGARIDIILPLEKE
ncbi:histidine kinase [Neobacillus drentensis]|uniref:sensor histidine kinase n=1 Tax=Neobacillus drentensis TaxID=220684 RepID=UPI001F28BD0F|nr:histidine kinase [Neobacillus drentensis]ULT54878.1 histidine kinase [Neobacillus drentensis]